MKHLFILCLCLAGSLHAADTVNPLSPSEAKEDKRLSPSLQPVADVPGLPRVLLIGDSISMGYTLRVRAALKDRANVHRPPTNCGSTRTGLAALDTWLGAGPWQVIHFNWGLHDLKYLKPGQQNVPLATYEANLRRLVLRLKQTGAVLVWAQTTPVPAEAEKGYARVPEDVMRYNEAARKIMQEHGVRINDLCAAVAPRLASLQNPRDVHFNTAGCDVLGAAVAAEIQAVLPARP